VVNLAFWHSRPTSRGLPIPAWLLFLLVLGDVRTSEAQFGGGGAFNPDAFIQSADRNQNGTLDPDEIQQNPFMRRMFESQGIDINRAMPIDEAKKLQQQFMERMRAGGGTGMGRAPAPPVARQPDNGDDSDDDEGGDPPAASPPVDSNRGRDRRGADNPQGGNRSSPDPRKNGGTDPKAKPRITMKLPDQYKNRDTNRDGQIGFYEWNRNDYAGFQKLDHNDDGFLTPQELARGPRKAASGTRAQRGSSSSSSLADSGRSTASPPVSDAPAPAKNAGETMFTMLDRNKDGSVSQDEWDRSFAAKGLFGRYGVNVTLPISRADFIRIYPVPSTK
jgi:EF hand